MSRRAKRRMGAAMMVGGLVLAAVSVTALTWGIGAFGGAVATVTGWSILTDRRELAR